MTADEQNASLGEMYTQLVKRLDEGSWNESSSFFVTNSIGSGCKFMSLRVGITISQALSTSWSQDRILSANYGWICWIKA